MKRTLITELPQHVGEQVTIRGWAQAVRDQKRVQFVVVRDESGLAQAVLGKDEPPTELNEQITSLTVESAITLTGTVVADERVKLGGVELQLQSIEVDSPPSPRCRSRRTPHWTSGSTGATWTCAGPTAG